MMPIDTQLILQLLGSFLIGSIPFASVAMWGSGVDIRSLGSGNPGFNNVLRYSKPRSLISLFGDVGKGYLPVWLFYDPEQFINFGWLFAMGAVFGHCYSPWLKFRGGKGIATSAGAMLAIYPALAATALVVFVAIRVFGSVRKLSEGGAYASLGTWVYFTVAIHFQLGMPHTRYALLMTVFLFWMHRSNIRRMLGR